MFLEWTQAARQHSIFFHLRPIFHFFIKCYPLVLKPWLQDCFNPCKALLLLQKMILPYSHVWTLISVISLVLEHWTRPGSWPCWNLTFSVYGWVNFWLFCFPMLVDGAAIQMVVVGLKEESRIFFGAAVGLRPLYSVQRMFFAWMSWRTREMSWVLSCRELVSEEMKTIKIW